MYIKHLFCSKWNIFTTESFSLFSLLKCKHPPQRMPFPHIMNILLGVCGLKSPQAELFYGR